MFGHQPRSIAELPEFHWGSQLRKQILSTWNPFELQRTTLELTHKSLAFFIMLLPNIFSIRTHHNSRFFCFHLTFAKLFSCRDLRQENEYKQPPPYPRAMHFAALPGPLVLESLTWPACTDIFVCWMVVAFVTFLFHLFAMPDVDVSIVVMELIIFKGLVLEKSCLTHLGCVGVEKDFVDSNRFSKDGC